jgi:RND family efflux transporter MFP subunit
MTTRHNHFCLGIAALLVAGCNNSSGPPGSAAPPPPEVLFTTPTVQMVTDFEDFPGRTEAVRSVDLQARVTGYLKEATFQEGSDVEQGKVLFVIDPLPYEAEEARAQAQLVQAEAKFNRLRNDYERVLKLFQEKAASREEFEKAAGDMKEANASIAVAKANLELAKINVGYTKLASPIKGRIGRHYIDPGNLVKADDTVLTTIVAYDEMYVTFDLDERTTLRLQKLLREARQRKTLTQGMPVYLAVLTGTLLPFDEVLEALDIHAKPARWLETQVRQGRGKIDPDKPLTILMGLVSETGFPRKGIIDFADNRLDPDSGTWRLRGKFDNAGRVLSPGLFVRVRLPIGEPYPATLVPEEALGTDQGQKFLYVIGEDNKVAYRRVKVGRLHDGLRVIEEGVQPGERLIVSGLQRVRQGQAVTPKKK